MRSQYRAVTKLFALRAAVAALLLFFGITQVFAAGNAPAGTGSRAAGQKYSQNDDKGSQKIESMDEAMPSEFTRDNGFAEAKEILSVDAKTGEIIGGADTEPSEASSGLSKPLGEKAGDADDDNPFE